jgi:tetratricopeptide (TPR) repeat protein
MALVYLKLESFSQARTSASQSLEMEPSLKAYLRRAQALFHLALYQDCINDCNKCLEMDNCLEAKSLKEKAAKSNVKINGKKMEIVEEVEEIYTEAGAAYNIPLVNDSDDDF